LPGLRKGHMPQGTHGIAAFSGAAVAFAAAISVGAETSSAPVTRPGDDPKEGQ
jgi:hypothetical protein